MRRYSGRDQPDAAPVQPCDQPPARVSRCPACIGIRADERQARRSAMAFVQSGQNRRDLEPGRAVPGDDDGLLSVDTSKLAGAVDFIQTKGIHQLMPQYKEVRAATLNFLLNGYFVSPTSKHPVVAAAVK